MHSDPWLKQLRNDFDLVLTLTRTSQCKYNIVVLSSLFYFLITIDGILIPQIYCIFVYIPYMYLCFTHKKDKSFHRELVLFPLGLCAAPVTVMSLRYATFSSFLCCKRKMGNCGNTLEPN